MHTCLYIFATALFVFLPSTNSAASFHCHCIGIVLNFAMKHGWVRRSLLKSCKRAVLPFVPEQPKHRPMKLDASLQAVSKHPYGPATSVTGHQAPAAALTTLTMSTSALQPAARLSSTSMQGGRQSEGPIAVADTCAGLSRVPPALPCTPLAASKRKSAPPTLADGGPPSPLQDYQYRDAGVGASGDALIAGEWDDTQQLAGGGDALEPVMGQDGQSALRLSAVTHHGAIAPIQAHTTSDSAAACWDRLWQQSAMAVLGSWEGDLTSDKGTEQSSEPSDCICEFWEEESLWETACAEPVGATWETSEPSATEEKAKDKNPWSQSAMHLDHEPQKGDWLRDRELQTTAKDEKLPEGSAPVSAEAAGPEDSQRQEHCIVGCSAGMPALPKTSPKRTQGILGLRRMFGLQKVRNP